MLFELVRCGWPNAVAVVALAVMPFVSLGLSAEQHATPQQIEIVDDGTTTAVTGIMGMTAQ
jgi:hypothetical protein